MLAYVGEFLFSFVMILVILWLLTESMQKFLYDETVASMFYRSLPAAAVCAGLVIALPFELQDLTIYAILVHPIAWVLIFKFLYLFQTAHAVVIGGAASILMTPLVTFTYQALFFREAVGA